MNKRIQVDIKIPFYTCELVVRSLWSKQANGDVWCSEDLNIPAKQVTKFISAFIEAPALISIKQGKVFVNKENNTILILRDSSGIAFLFSEESWKVLSNWLNEPFDHEQYSRECLCDCIDCKTRRQWTHQKN